MESTNESGVRQYVVIFALLIGLLTLSIPVALYGSGTVSTLIIYGVATAKAYLVMHDYMHMKLEPRFITIIMIGCFAAVVYMFVLLYPDVVLHS